MPLDRWFVRGAVGKVRAAGARTKTHSRARYHVAGEALRRRSAPYWRGELRVSGALDTCNSGERLSAFTGRIAITALTLIALYTLLVSALPKEAAALTVDFAITPFIITVFAAVMGPVVFCSGFPRSFFGLQTNNWKNALGFSVVASLAFLGAAASLKLALIHTTETFSSCSLFHAAAGRENMHQVKMPPLYWVALGLYLGFTPLQEFVVRCCLQAPLHALLSGTEHWRRVWSILVSDLVFAAAHAHISVAFAVVAFVPGLLWGWIFARTNSFIAAAASHFVIGGTGIFLLGIEGVVAKLMG
jgi:membrane protease YdiL (CAAX protease family)